MRALHAALTAAQQSSSGKPHVEAEIVAIVGAARRFAWQHYYEGAELDYFYDSCIAGDGSFNRIRGGNPSAGFYLDRVTNPDEHSDYSTWWHLGHNAIDVAMSALDTEVLMWYIDDANGWIRRRESNDYGYTWGSWINQNFIGTDEQNYRCAGCHKGNGDALSIWSDGLTVYRRRRISGVWDAVAVAWTNTLVWITGLACCHQGDWNVIVTGVDLNGRSGVWSCVLGDSFSMTPDTWSDLEEIITADPGSDVFYYMPSLDMPDVFRTFFIETYSGVDSYSRPYWSHGLPNAHFISNLWREPIPFNLDCTYGVSITHDLTREDSTVWLSRTADVFRASLTPQFVDVTKDILELAMSTKETTGGLIMTLSNDEGRYNPNGADPTDWWLGSKINLKFGYATTAGKKYSMVKAHWITDIEYLSDPKKGRGTVTLTAVDGWGLMEMWKARRQLKWNAGDQNIFQLLRWISARAGLEFSSFSYSMDIFRQPAFTINPGESGRRGAVRLLSFVPDVALWVTDMLLLIYPTSIDASVYEYGFSHHPILGGRYKRQRLDCNRAQVFADPHAAIFAEDFEWDEIDLVFDTLRSVHDVNLTVLGDAQARAVAMLRDAEMNRHDGELAAPLNCGADIYDVVEVTDSVAGLDADRFRVMEQSHYFRPSKSIYQIKIGLGKP